MTVKICKSKPLNLLPKTPKRGKNYKSNCRIHFSNRFRERIGYEFTDGTEKRLRESLKNAKFIGPGDGLNSVWRVNFDGMEIKVVWNRFKDILVTTLPN
jgi:hypothetical protein